ncbi:MAG TPA: protein-disulfide reductase DsbD domain-containing protein [Aliidongia sp.]|uniref:protein-disulfide reductase DsbD family protein n=1 Tax=Aliidongia sp. TaxID=1914230 RepID=UPI002DDCF1CF|nr:protein-disulfide reductase DsbD domain-containing protein [Aliidongia sp.]HEV2676583.1 protein-disulfide reductase DsbD domain-containing protein [Aliidongia sp.]
MFPRSWLLRLAALLALCPLAHGQARAEDYASDWARTEQGAVRLVVAPTRDGALRLGLAFRLEPHWKIYWRSPGDAGLPPTADWTGTENAEVGEFAWPVPERFELSGLETFGYEGEVVLPVAVAVPHPGEPVHLSAAVDFLTCRELCVPNNVTLDLTVPAGLEGPGPYGELIDQFQARVPGDGSTGGLTLEAASAGGTGKAARLDLTLRTTPPMGQPDAIVEGASPVVFGPPTMAAGGLETHLVLSALDGADGLAKLVGAPLTITVIDRSAPADAPRAATVTLVVAPLADGGSAADLLAVMAVAVLGGFILNFMPCVLPVLSIKLLALVGEAGQGRQRARASFLATAVGILSSFLVMAAALVTAKSAGLSIGWGVQFQEPVFLAALAALVTLFACNLMGWFEIQLPWWLAGRLQGGGSSLAGSFLSGAFATLLATPCSAPFLGTAVGFALAGGPADIFLIFACLGIGLALPYLVVAALPALARFLPRPGSWMVTLRRILGLLLAGTAVWLVWVLREQAGTVAAGAVAVLGIAATAALAFGHRVPRLGRGFAPVSAILLLGMLAPPAFLARTGDAAALGAGWARFDQAAIAPAVAKGQVVFVDVTASWCLTCQVNERLVLDKPDVKASLGAAGVVAMRADWTRPDPAITDFLKHYGRYGIPFNVVYGPGAPDGLPLSEVLTSTAVEAALAKAKGVAKS